MGSATRRAARRSRLGERAAAAARALAALAGAAALVAPGRLAFADGGPACKRGGGKLSCWDGELVVRESSLDHPELLAKAPPGASAAVFRHRHACAIVGGALACWGDNEAGQLGDGTTKPRPAPRRVALAGRVVQASLGWGHTCALRADAKVFCWGSGHPKPAPVALPADVVEISAGGQHSC
ncbi:MAG TPA: RCC1 domain-containing protein, partial [Polyangiaceae bacterium]|nr:RCC1 domain-containing protein [Polyangiaceae bacterium]